jgi:hypothetical protein
MHCEQPKQGKAVKIQVTTMQDYTAFGFLNGVGRIEWNSWIPANFHEMHYLWFTQEDQ